MGLPLNLLLRMILPQRNGRNLSALSLQNSNPLLALVSLHFGSILVLQLLNGVLLVEIDIFVTAFLPELGDNGVSL